MKRDIGQHTHHSAECRETYHDDEEISEFDQELEDAARIALIRNRMKKQKRAFSNRQD